MRLLALSLVLSSCAVAVLAWTASPERLPRGAAPNVVERAPVAIPPAVAATERVEVAQAAPPAVVYGTGDWLVPQDRAVDVPIDPCATARAHFHAQVRIEELARALSPDVDRANVSRALYPDYFDAVDESTRLYVAFAAIAPPAASEPLPALDVWAKDDALARVYRGLSREELLYEHWRIERAAFAESKRVLDERLEHGPYEVTRRDGLIADG